LPIKGNTCVGVAVNGVVCNLGSAGGSTYPGMALVDSDEGSTITEGTSSPFTASSPSTSSTFCFDCLGFGELLKIQEKGRNQPKSANKSTRKFRKSTYLGVLSSSPPGEALVLCFRAVTLCLLE
jgi:hypothetical protein